MHRSNSIPLIHSCRLGDPTRSQDRIASVSRSFHILILLCVAVLLIACPGVVRSAFAQTFTATMTGTISDASGAPIANAPIIIRNVGTNEERKLSSDASGHYTAPQLAPGQY